MRRDELREYLMREPFQPFRLLLSCGVFFDIRKPEMVEVTRSTLTIGMDVESDKQRFVVISLVHIVWLEVLVPVP
jgi:hypothetical protein